MATTDNNGIVQIQTSDDISPFQSLVNSVSSSVSNAFNANVRTFKVADATARNTLATTRVPSISEPLLVWRQDTGRFELNEGTGWQNWPQSDIVLPGPNDIVINGTTYQRTGEFSSVPAKSLTWRSPIAYANISLPRPYAPPTGWGFAVHVLASPRFPSVAVANPTSSPLEIRWSQVGSNSWGAGTRIGWTLVKLK